ncbi:hypothetical protein QBC38DRAFT_246971 [Podospora fimiseda]|uniref:BZIP domain-containing protein n=1 Tax=Podospora fimiseda TaxID=252190 RepID=A0AAN7BXB5_9PEZI|nr:hypothetical protein QBC38DRAFT_246971 [Podospora fimiseda]
MSTTPSEGTNRNLARIRDNQRRARARKKEYVEELEQRIREFEQQRVQATTEVQIAARKVVEENRKLRELLRLHGVSEGSIEEYLVAGGDNRTLQPQHPRRSDKPRSHQHQSSKTVDEEHDEHDCSAAADLISLMTGANPHEVRASLGCAPGTDCRVRDNIVGDAINKLTTTKTGS